MTNSQIESLRVEAANHGDLVQEALCVLALGGTEALKGAEPGTEFDRLTRLGTSQDEARAACALALEGA